MPTAEQLQAARDHGHNTDLIEVSSRWLRDGRCCGRKPLAYRRPTPHFFCTRCSADYDPDGNQIENWGWRRSIAGTFVSKSWPTAETYRSAVRDHGAPAPLRSWPSTPDAEGGRLKMLHGRTHLHEFKRDDGSIILIEYKRNPYFGATGPSWNDPGSPAEGGDVAEWEADDGVTLSAAEEERATDELNAIPFDPYEEDYGDA